MDSVFAFMDAFLQSDAVTITFNKEQMQTVRDLAAIHWEAQQARNANLENQQAILTTALQWIVDCWGADETDYCRADMQGAINSGREALAWMPGTKEGEQGILWPNRKADI